MSDAAPRPEIARIDFDALVPAGATSVRKVLYEEPYELMPRDQSVSVNVYAGSSRPARATPDTSITARPSSR